jgi:hypothetical protein
MYLAIDEKTVFLPLGISILNSFIALSSCYKLSYRNFILAFVWNLNRRG